MTTQLTVEGFRPSPQQARTWGLQDDAAPWAFRAQCRLIVDGPLDHEALEAALQDVVDRHEILRTSVETLRHVSVPVQVVHDRAPVAMEIRDLTSVAPDQRDAEGRRVALERRTSDEDPGAAPATDACLLAFAPTEHQLVLTAPATCCDEASLEIVVHELVNAYADRTGGDAEDAEDPLQYADLAEWLNETSDAEAASAGASFWRDGAAAEAALQAASLVSRSPTSAEPFAPEAVSVPVSAATLSSIVNGPGRESLTGESFLFACWATFLWRMRPDGAVVVGVRADGRDYEELRAAVGPLARYVPVRGDLTGDAAFADVARVLDGAVAEARDRWPAKDSTSAPPFLAACFEFSEGPDPLEVGELRFSVVDVDACIDRFDLKLSCRVTAEGLAAVLRHDGNRFATADVERLANELRVLIESAAANPGQAVEDLSVVPAQEAELILGGFSGTGPDKGSEACIHELFEDQVRRTPAATAVTWLDRTLTYSELDERAEALAARLRQSGVGRDQPVGILLDRTPDMLVGILGILKAGGAYLPLDPVYPSERISFMLEDADARVVLTNTRLSGRPLDGGITTVLVDGAEPAPAKVEDESSMAAEQAPRADDLAYVIYTSGSTGRPKGVLVTHRNVVSSTQARLTYYADPVGRYLLLASYSFDSSVAGIFWTLSTGGALVLPPEGSEVDAHAMAALIREHQVSHVLILPSLYRMFLSQANARDLASLECVIVAGEACDSSLVEDHYARLPEAALFNEYGPTEATVWATVHRIEEKSSDTRVPIGRPIDNAKVYVVDGKMRPLPIGWTGELVIGGAGVTRGYVDRPELTESRFVDNHLGDGAGKKLYRTGDCGRLRSDGVLEFLGRTDDQVKIRGYRIELGEIESVLATHPDIQRLAVVDREGLGGSRRLVAFVVSETARRPSSDELRGFLRARIPDFMIPERFVPVASLPLLPNGKVDRKALPDENAAHLAERDELYVAPGTELESLLADRWMEALREEHLGVHENFFGVGGNSITAAILMNRLRGDLGDFLHVAMLFEHPSVSQLAGYLERHHEAEVRQAIEAGPNGGAAAASRIIPAADLTSAEVQSVQAMSDEQVEDKLKEMLEDKAD
jgi:amino acid adenylation domain-containing protein